MSSMFGYSYEIDGDGRTHLTYGHGGVMDNVFAMGGRGIVQSGIVKSIPTSDNVGLITSSARWTWILLADASK